MIFDVRRPRSNPGAVLWRGVDQKSRDYHIQVPASSVSAPLAMPPEVIAPPTNMALG
jgi:hypothetical protein